MTEAEFLRRFDAHLVRLDDRLARIDDHMELTREHIARGNEIMARNNEVFEQMREELRLSRESHADLRAFTRDLTRRNELVWRDVRKGLADVSDDIRAQTGAILSVLDRLDAQDR